MICCRASHGQQLSAYRHLLCPPYEPETNQHISPEAAAAHNAAVVAAFQTEVAVDPAAALPVPAPAGAGAAVTGAPAQAAAALIAEGAMSRPSSAVSLGSAVGTSGTAKTAVVDAGTMVAGGPEAQDHAARGSGSGSETRRRNAKKQAAAAAVLAAVDAVPGASHRLIELAANSSSSKKRTRRSRKKKGSDGSSSAAGPVAWKQQQQCRQATEGEQLESMKLRRARGLSQLGVAAICCAWGKAQEAATLHAMLQVGGWLSRQDRLRCVCLLHAPRLLPLSFTRL